MIPLFVKTSHKIILSESHPCAINALPLQYSNPENEAGPNTIYYFDQPLLSRHHQESSLHGETILEQAGISSGQCE